MTPLPTTLTPQNNLAVVLVEPRIPQNVGNIARLCACTGAPLYVVGELGYRSNEAFITQMQRAGMDYIDAAPPTHVATMAEVWAAFPGWTPWFFTSKTTQSFWQPTYPPQSLLIFGREDKGLPSAVLEQFPAQCVRIPMQSGQRSLNLSSSAAVAVYEVLRQWESV